MNFFLSTPLHFTIALKKKENATRVSLIRETLATVPICILVSPAAFVTHRSMSSLKVLSHIGTEYQTRSLGLRRVELGFDVINSFFCPDDPGQSKTTAYKNLAGICFKTQEGFNAAAI